MKRYQDLMPEELAELFWIACGLTETKPDVKISRSYGVENLDLTILVHTENHSNFINFFNNGAITRLQINSSYQISSSKPSPINDIWAFYKKSKELDLIYLQ